MGFEELDSGVRNVSGVFLGQEVAPRPLLPILSSLCVLSHKRVDLLFNVAGVLGDGKNTPGPERSLRAMDREWLRHTLEVNTIGPMMLVAALAPLLESPSKKGDLGARPPSVVVNFSARVGSIGDNGMGGWHSYRMSKVRRGFALADGADCWACVCASCQVSDVAVPVGHFYVATNI